MIKEIQAGYLSSPYFKDLYLFLSQNKLPSKRSAIKKVETLAESFVLLDSLIFKLVMTPDKEATVLAIPETCIDKIITLYHTSLFAGHQGVVKTYLTMKDKFFIPNLMHHLRSFIKGCHICQLSRSNKLPTRQLQPQIYLNYRLMSLSEDASEAFQALKQACMNSPVLAFADYMKDFLLKTDVSKEELGAVLSQKQADGWFHPVAYGSWALTAHEKNYHSTKLEFLTLKWAVTEHYKEYLLYQPFLVKTDNNPLTYIMTTPNLDATGHQWVGALAKFSFQLEYQKGRDNAVADVLSQITTRVGPEAMQAILDGAIIGASQRAKGENATVIKGDQEREKEV